MIKKLACATVLAATVLAAPADAGRLQLGVLSCAVDGGTAYIIGSNKGISCTFRPNQGGPSEAYTGMISKLGVDVGQTGQGQIVWAVLAATSRHGDLAGRYYGVNAEASVAAGGGANLLVGGFENAFSLQPLNVQGQTGLNLAVAVTALQLIHSFK
jgi:hypothetical protein